MEKESDGLNLTISHDGNVEEGYFLSQEEMRQLLISFRQETNLSVEMLAKLMDIDPEILRDYENGRFDLKLEAYRLMFYIYSMLNDDFNLRN